MAAYTIAQLRILARSRDERLEDQDRYSDSWIDDKIEHAFEVAESAKQVFEKFEEFDLSSAVANGDSIALIQMSEVVHNIFHVSHEDCFESEIVSKASIQITILPNAKTSLSKKISVRYFYYPKLPIDTIEMSPEVYHLFRHSLYVNLYGSLRDKENEMYHQAQVDRFVKEGSFTPPDDFNNILSDKFSRNAWV